MLPWCNSPTKNWQRARPPLPQWARLWPFVVCFCSFNMKSLKMQWPFVDSFLFFQHEKSENAMPVHWFVFVLSTWKVWKCNTVETFIKSMIFGTTYLWDLYTRMWALLSVRSLFAVRLMGFSKYFKVFQALAFILWVPVTCPLPYRPRQWNQVGEPAVKNIFQGADLKSSMRVSLCVAPDTSAHGQCEVIRKRIGERRS